MHKVWGDNLQAGFIRLESSNSVNACGRKGTVQQ